MKKIILLILLVFAAGYMMAGCGVKSDLDHPNRGDFPRNYPVY